MTGWTAERIPIGVLPSLGGGVGQLAGAVRAPPADAHR